MILRDILVTGCTVAPFLRCYRRLPAIGFTPHGEFVDTVRPRMVTVIGHPCLKFTVTRSIGGRMHIALIEHMPVQTPVVNLLQKLFCRLHLAVMLQSLPANPADGPFMAVPLVYCTINRKAVSMTQ